MSSLFFAPPLPSPSNKAGWAFTVNCSGIKLVEHAMKVLERVIERRVRNIVKIDSMQFVFMAGKSTTDAIFIVRQLQEKYLFGKE